jgi:hypothetical protein
MRVLVDCTAGYRGEETPRRCELEGRWLDVLEVVDRWYGPDYRYFKVRASDGVLYLLRHDERGDAWELTGIAPGR